MSPDKVCLPVRKGHYPNMIWTVQETHTTPSPWHHSPPPLGWALHLMTPQSHLILIFLKRQKHFKSQRLGIFASLAKALFSLYVWWTLCNQFWPEQLRFGLCALAESLRGVPHVRRLSRVLKAYPLWELGLDPQWLWDSPSWGGIRRPSSARWLLRSASGWLPYARIPPLHLPPSVLADGD